MSCTTFVWLLLLETKLDCRGVIATEQLCSFNPTCNMHSKHQSKGSIDFDFWGACKTSYSEHARDEFHFREHIGDGFGDYSPPLWKENGSRIITHESSPLLPYNHQYSNISPRTRSQAIAEGRRELMEMIHDMPEWGYELSLKDIVDEQKTMQEVKEEIVTEEGSYCFENEAEIKKQKKKKKIKSIKSSEISRSESMEKETILIKMFFPRSLVSKKNATIKNRSKVSPRTSLEISENNSDKEQWFRRSFVAGESKSNLGKHHSSSNSGNNSTSRHAESTYSAGCWPSFHTKKKKTRRPSGCIF